MLQVDRRAVTQLRSLGGGDTVLCKRMGCTLSIQMNFTGANKKNPNGSHYNISVHSCYILRTAVTHGMKEAIDIGIGINGRVAF